MRVIAVDDEKLTLESMGAKLAQIERISEVDIFASPRKALDYLETHEVDVAFLDVNMSEMSGLGLAAEIRRLHPKTAIIFTTGYSQYAVDAYRIHAEGYLMKPVDVDDIDDELDQLERGFVPHPSGKRVRVQTFGNFEVFADEVPVAFRYAKSKEMLAYLVDRRGASVNTSELMLVLFEDAEDTPSQRGYLRHIIASLVDGLKVAGVEDVFIKARNRFSIDTSAIDCDFYRFLDNDVAVINQYNGEYMLQYSWAEMTLGVLSDTAGRITGSD